MATVGMLYSEQTQRFYGGAKHQENTRDHDQYLDASYIDQFKLLVLPNIAALSDKQCQQIKDYEDRGGSIIATFETSLYNEKGEKRNDFGLRDLLGVSFG